VLGGKVGNLVFEENQAGCVFERLCSGVGFESGFGNPSGHIVGFSRWHPGLKQEFACSVRLFYIQRFPPCVVARFVEWVAVAWHRPALQVLTARGKAEKYRGIGY
jgi:hypothetical protein